MATTAFLVVKFYFPETVEKYKIFGFTIIKENSFNQSLFIQLVIGILFIFVAHLISRLLFTTISTGNAILAILLTISIECFIVGINIPMLNTQKFWIFKDHFSLLQILTKLYQKREMELFYIMLCFTFILPILKFIVMTYEIFISKSDQKTGILLSLLSKWAMLDVLIIGVLVMTSREGVIEITSGTGLMLFTLSIILSLLISQFSRYTKNYHSY